jgi:hypothetical protein
MTKGRAAQDEPQPIEAEFEPSYAPQERPKGFSPPPLRSRSATVPQLLMASGAAALLGAVMAIAVTNANSGAETGTLARELDNLAGSQAELSARAERMSADVVAIRSALDSQADRIGQQDKAELSLRTEIAAVASQVSALTGAGGGAPTAGTSASNTPLGVLLGRLTRLETILAEDAATPSTTGQMQRSVRDLKTQVEQLYSANATLAEVLGQREASIAALETSLNAVTGEVAAIRGETAKARQVGFALGMVKPEAATQAPFPVNPNTLRAFSLMELAAERGSSFVTEQQALALLLPHDMDVASLDDLAREGVLTPDQLKLRFEAAARSAERVIGSKPDDGWAWLRASIPGVSGANGAKAMTLVGEAQTAAQAGDLRAAVAVLMELPQPAGAGFEAWAKLAQRRADLDARLASLSGRLNRAALGSTEG